MSPAWYEGASREDLIDTILDLQGDLEKAQDQGATLMLDQMTRAVADGGRFSDERANRFVDAVKRAEQRRHLIAALREWLRNDDERPPRHTTRAFHVLEWLDAYEKEHP